VYRALCKPTNETVAIKVLDLERQDPGKLVRSACTLCQVSEREALACARAARHARSSVCRRRPCVVRVVRGGRARLAAPQR
jgi:hypothetical protein